MSKKSLKSANAQNYGQTREREIISGQMQPGYMYKNEANMKWFPERDQEKFTFHQKLVS